MVQAGVNAMLSRVFVCSSHHLLLLKIGWPRMIFRNLTYCCVLVIK